MSDRVDTYLKTQLIGGGIAIVDARLAFSLAPWHWPSLQNCINDFGPTESIVKRFSAGSFVVSTKYEDRGITILARSLTNLPARLEYLSGIKFAKSDLIDVELLRSLTDDEVKSPTAPVFERVNRLAYKRQKMQEAAAKNEALRAERLDEARRHEEWTASVKLKAANSRRMHFEAKRGGGHG